ncbi:hypothetical protein ACFOSC_26400 [Streptantibioticus rubrisoli]|uniref:Uncharacterized protein n=1 Tax=Streptantibioticus rubrisoli TaxID=1387313 RepID=A0ABT1PEK5_9ACTN|nr:hypothetical protein [Streptantibioticus rubrisoli]MCQ4043789.1 hypothetical protein [Streptantibioticus rubrisoli]
MSDTLARLPTSGVSTWLDELSRRRLVDASLGRLAAYWHVTSATTHPAIFTTAIETSDCCDGREIPALGADYADVVQVLEDEGVEKFDASWNELAQKLAVSPHEPDGSQTDHSREKV